MLLRNQTALHMVIVKNIKKLSLKTLHANRPGKEYVIGYEINTLNHILNQPNEINILKFKKIT